MNAHDTGYQPFRGLRGLKNVMSSSTPRKSEDSISPPHSAIPHSQSEYSFSRYEASSRVNPVSRYNTRRLSTASSITSIGGALDTSSGTWSETVREAGQNGKERLELLERRWLINAQLYLRFFNHQLFEPVCSPIRQLQHQVRIVFQLLETSHPSLSRTFLMWILQNSSHI